MTKDLRKAIGLAFAMALGALFGLFPYIPKVESSPPPREVAAMRFAVNLPVTVIGGAILGALLWKTIEARQKARTDG